jgi:phage tail-like protein
MNGPAERVDPARNYNFIIEIAGDAYGTFMECSGPEATTEVIEQRVGGDQGVRKLPGRTTFSDITLKYGVTATPTLWEWRAAIIRGDVPTPKKSGAIVVFDIRNNSEVARWAFDGAWPTKWTGPALDARSNEVAVETLVLAVESLRRV